MKKIIIAAILSIVAISVFANGQIEGPRDGSRPMTQQQLQECFVDGEFNMELFLENSPITAKLDADSDGIVDGTNVSVKDFMTDRIDALPMQRMQGGRIADRGRKPARGQSRR